MSSLQALSAWSAHLLRDAHRVDLVHPGRVRITPSFQRHDPTPILTATAVDDARGEGPSAPAGQAATVAWLEALLLRHDPIGLNFGDNIDEYHAEANSIARRLPETTSPADVCRVAHEVFVRWFDADLAGPQSAYEAIAQEIWQQQEPKATGVTEAEPWSMRRWAHVIDRPQDVDKALARNDPYAGVALLTLVLGHPDPDVVLPRILRGLAAPQPENRVNALQALGHHARLHHTVDATSIAMLRAALRDRSPLRQYSVHGYASNAAADIAMFVPRRGMPRWLRRRFAGPRRPRCRCPRLAR